MRTPCLFTIAALVFAGCEKSPRPKDDKPVEPKYTTCSNDNPTLPEKKKPQPVSYGLPWDQAKAGTIKLFDGHSLFGWEANSDADWAVKEGVIAASEGKPGLLLTTVPFADYELSFECRLAKGGNSGVFLRTVRKPADPGKDCYEYNLCDTHKTHATGSLVARKVADVAVKTEGDWQKHSLSVKGNRFIARIDGKKVLDFTDESETQRSIGHIGLQFREGKIEFRNVLLTPLGETRVRFDTWKPTPGGTAKIITKGETAELKAGKGNLRSDKQWGDFLLGVDVRTNAKDTNSGIFFRAMKDAPKQSPNGYELQVCNKIKDGDRTKPDDYKTGFGTGAIFRRQKVRRVISDDKQWCRLTLVAYGNRFATWVNGYQVADFVDKRPANENPRRGTRLTAGYLFLQCHDPTTDVSFRFMDVVELPAVKGGAAAKK